MNLFQTGNFTFHSGLKNSFKIECDALTYDDWQSLAQIAAKILPPFGSVEGVPEGGLNLAKMLEEYVSQGPLLIVDDVLTTGGSMEVQRNNRKAIGLVVFARTTPPDWIIPMFHAHIGML